MGDATQAAIEAAIRAHVADEAEGAYLTDYVWIASAAVAEDPRATVYVSEGSDGPFHARLGLVRYLDLATKQHFDCGDDD